jgi:predicted esterase
MPRSARSNLTFRLVSLCLISLSGVGSLGAEERARVAEDPLVSLQAYLDANGDWAALPEQVFAAVPLTAGQARAARESLVAAHRQRLNESRRPEHQAKLIEIDGRKMKYEVRAFGDRPQAGHSLYLSLHGGGGAPPQVNEQQWENQKGLYQLEEGLYIAPRAPTDTWDLWHQAHIDRFFTRLIENMIALEGINPDRVYLTGYSAGGDGVYQVAPRMADRFAAAAMMAGHPNETQPLGLRNLPFTLHVGENDSPYGRNQQARAWKGELAKLRQQDQEGYEHWVEIHPGKGHWMDRQDASGIRWMGKFTRNLTPPRVTWLQDDVLQDRFYWLAVPPERARARQLVIVARDANRFEIERCDAEQLTILLRDDFVDLEQPIEIDYQGQSLFAGRVERNIANLARTLVDRGDPDAMFAASVTVTVPQATPSPNSSQP